jgi:hypothetical protein
LQICWEDNDEFSTAQNDEATIGRRNREPAGTTSPNEGRRRAAEPI